jgi:hypothetical protein
MSYAENLAEGLIKNPVERKYAHLLFGDFKNGPEGFHATLDNVLKIIAKSEPENQFRALQSIKWAVSNHVSDADLDESLTRHQIPSYMTEEVEFKHAMARLSHKRKTPF